MTSSGLTRRRFLKAASVAPLALTPLACSSPSYKARKPNLLVIWTDEQRADTMSVYGNRKIHAPNLNKFASESIVFRNSYVTQPICTPSRSTVMTGLWPHTNGCTFNNIPLPKSVKTFPELVNDSDYRTGYFGKWHLGDEIFAQHGFDEWQAIEDGYYKHYRPECDSTTRSGYHHWLMEKGYQPDRKDPDIFSRRFCARLPLEHCKPRFLEEKTIDFLTRHRNDPFMLYVNFLEPHMPFFGPLNDRHRPDQIDLPDNFNDAVDADDPIRYRLIHKRIHEKLYDGHDLNTESGWRRLIANYWGLVSQVDLSVGNILMAIERLGLDDNTIVVFTSDHGDMMGSHRLLMKTVMYEESVKVPWLMRIPQLARRQKIINHSVSHIDLVPTLLDLMGLAPNPSLPGQSLTPMIQVQTVEQNHVFVEWHPHPNADTQIHTTSPLPDVSPEEFTRALAARTRTVISPDGWKLALSDHDKNLLFNLNDDPLETTNLFDRPQYREIIKRLTWQIAQWQQHTNDPVTGCV